MTQLTHPTLARTLAPASGLTRDLLLIAGGAALIALLAQAELPLKPVPVTLQTLGVLLVGAALGWKRAFAALALYLAAGAVGLPVFAGGIGSVAKFAGPTGGFLLSFPFAAALVGFLVERFALDRRPAGTVLAMLAGSAVIYALGLLWLGAVTGLSGQPLLGAGLIPFLPGDALKLGLAATLLPGAWALVGRR
ncbi:biotin biosynthesis protein BioY [Deinococcus radiopugnans]|uniref:Biotin transporter n=1 Tax=Deinococcus radiopugnans TaxID=57497 RepID=A0A0A7KL75_9DEIO|nr:biotin transporter BioY [Deinococcus radiopugnans]AIZ46009.1 biotin biosynthesis protein BioY [Deinococcus radiopugnans]QLG11868.1 biotin transporter BioY [Deinococcus sp. D7000]